jgi:class 3 adenylate cyclase/PAS domain-containing protein
MSEDTVRKEELGKAEKSASSQEAARKLVQKADELTTLLKNQRDVLRPRGMTLPTGTLETVQAVKARLDNLNRQILNTLIELRTLRALADTTALITSNLDPDDVLNQVIDTVIGLTGAERGFVVLKNKTTGELDDFRVARGLDFASPTGTGQGRDFVISRTIINEVAQTGEAVLTTNAVNDPRFQEQQSIVGFALRSVMAVPLKARGALIGVVYCDNRALSGLFSPKEKSLLTAFADHAAVAIENARLFSSVREQLTQVTRLKDLLERIFESITAGVVTLDANGLIQTCNRAGMQILNQQASPVGQKFSDVLPAAPAPLVNAFASVRSTSQPMLVDCEPEVGERGTASWNVVLSVLKGVGGQGNGIALVINDLTDQRKHEAQLAEAMRYLPNALFKNLREIANTEFGGEEREITAMFCDVRGFTAFSENLDPQDLMHVINQYLSLSSDAINLYEGIVDKYLGDAVTGLFNTQLNPQSDHAVRAVSAGLSMLADLAALHETMPETNRLFYGIGIHTGQAILGNVGSAERKEFAALGEATEICKILQENARGFVIISAETHARVQDQFDCELITLHDTKGRADLTTAYKVLRRRKGHSPISTLLDDDVITQPGES